MRSTYSPAYGTALPLSEPVDSTPEPVRRLGELLALMVAGAPFLWTSTTQFGGAGYVTITYNLDPTKIDQATRDELLSLAARLANWHHEDALT